MSFAKAGNFGFPRIGGQRELKFALESFWADKSEESFLLEAARSLRQATGSCGQSVKRNSAIALAATVLP